MAKKKIKKFLKKVAPLVAAGLGAAALGKRNRRNAMLNSATADDGFGFMTMKDYGPYSIGNNFKPKKQMTFPAGDYSRIENYMSKGGRVGCGVAKRGFGRAMKKGGKK